MILKIDTGESDIFVLFILGLLTFSQVGVLAWKKYYPKSFRSTTLIGLWLIPPILAIQLGNFLYVSVCVVYTLVSFVIFKKSRERPLRPQTPRMIYRWFTCIHRITYFIGMCGYTVLIISLFIEGQVILLEIGLYLAFYGLYFGVLNKDLVEEISSRMALNVGYIQPSGIPTKNLIDNICPICGGAVNENTDKACKLDCNHVYHNDCIRGWIIIGKKTTCPYCKEKVDTEKLSDSPWHTTQILYLNLLDFARYLLVWQPVIIVVVESILRLVNKEQQQQ